jgi:c(7)-type cytochrome triheme protein
MKSGSFGATVADHNAGQQYCWACHNGTKAFAAQGNCAKCHTK